MEKSLRGQASSPARWNIRASRWMLDSSSVIKVMFVARARCFEAFMSHFLHPSGKKTCLLRRACEPTLFSGMGIARQNY